jgi:hypothetical protein
VGADARHIERVAARVAAELAWISCGAARPTRGRRVLRGFALAWQVVARKAKTLVREHWDIGLFDVLFGSLKAFAVYPALFFAGLAWTIPIMEYLPLNTQLWTAGYLAVRGHVLSEIGRRRYGHSLKQLDALRDRLLRVHPRDARHVHGFTVGGDRRVLRVRRSRFRHWLARWRGEGREPGVVLQSELRRMVRDPEFLFRANPLRANPYLYEEVLLARLLATPQAHVRLMASSAPEEPLEGEGRALRAALGESHVLALARLAEQADALAAAQPGRLGATALCLRWIHASLRRAVWRRLRSLADFEYRLLAEIADGGTVATSLVVPARAKPGPPRSASLRLAARAFGASPQLAALRSERAELRAEIARAAHLAERAKAVGCGPEAGRLAREALADARAHGLAARRAHLAAWLGDCLPAASSSQIPVRGSAG